MLRKLSIVGAGTLLPMLLGDTAPAMRVLLVLITSMVWLIALLWVHIWSCGGPPSTAHYNTTRTKDALCVFVHILKRNNESARAVYKKPGTNPV